jgi:hypothetical protein
MSEVIIISNIYLLFYNDGRLKIRKESKIKILNLDILFSEIIFIIID